MNKNAYGIQMTKDYYYTLIYLLRKYGEPISNGGGSINGSIDYRETT